jgi:hypothetical protein
MASIVIPLGSGSRHGNRELLYALRSFEKHLKGISNVVIVGECPEFLQNIIHIPFKDLSHKQANIRSKILAACDDDRVSEDFCFLNDDVFLLQDLDINSIPYWYSGDLSTYKEEGTKALIEELGWRELPTKRFDLHQPITYNKQKFIEAVSGFHDRCLIKSTYCNYWKIEGEPIVDIKVRHPHSYQWICENLPGRIYFSVGENKEVSADGLNPSMWKFLDKQFPNKSKYEV